MTALSLQGLPPWLMTTTTSFLQSGGRILLIVLAAYVISRFIKLGLRHLEAVLFRARSGDDVRSGRDAVRKRVTTLIGLLRTISLSVVWAIVVIMALAEVGLDVTPILAGAGIIGLAVGFGAQNVVRDLISGFFLVLEDQVRVGDVAVINGTGGLVETITFRTIVLRDLAGIVHVFPNGTITSLSNMTKDWSAYVLDVGVAYKEETDRIVEIMRAVAEEMRKEPDFQNKMLDPIEIFGVDAFGESAVTIKARLKTQPMEQWTVGREYRRRLKKAFDHLGIEIPFPQRSFSMSSSTEPLKVQLTQSGARN
jgi:small-conductance mechanosensitive channel